MNLEGDYYVTNLSGDSLCWQGSPGLEISCLCLLSARIAMGSRHAPSWAGLLMDTWLPFSPATEAWEITYTRSS